MKTFRFQDKPNKLEALIQTTKEVTRKKEADLHFSSIIKQHPKLSTQRTTYQNYTTAPKKYKIPSNYPCINDLPCFNDLPCINDLPVEFVPLIHNVSCAAISSNDVPVEFVPILFNVARAAIAINESPVDFFPILFNVIGGSIGMNDSAVELVPILLLLDGNTGVTTELNGSSDIAACRYCYISAREESGITTKRGRKFDHPFKLPLKRTFTSQNCPTSSTRIKSY